MDIDEEEFNNDNVLTEITAITEILVKKATDLTIGLNVVGTGGTLNINKKQTVIGCLL